MHTPHQKTSKLRKNLIYSLIFLLLSVALVACGPPPEGTTGNGATDAEQGSSSAEARPTPTPIILATPTPRPAPPTPTPRPSPTPTEEVPPTATPETEAEAPAEPEPTPTPAPAIDTEMVTVLGGPFTMGSDDADPEAAPAQVIDLPTFEIDKFEVTNNDFSRFVEATGYQTASDQSGGRTWADYATGKGNHPVVKVTWDDAVAFCEWAGKRLPTEQEWEKAARGDDARVYPWGNEFDSTLANVKETGLRDTTAVGSFPGGASPYGAEDMGGNVWEWTSTWFQAYEGGSNDNQYYGERFRVTRGGAWFEEPPQVATFNRNAADPAITANNDLGFRCVRDVSE